MRSLHPWAISTQRTMHVSGGQSDNISQVGCSCEPIIITLSDIRRTVGFKPGNMIYYGKKDFKRVVPLGNPNLIEIDPKVSTPVLQFPQRHHFPKIGKDYFSCSRYNLALNTETTYSTGNLRHSTNSRCSPYQEACNIWIGSKHQGIEIQNVYSWTFEITCETLT